jgi:putative protease
VVPNTLKPLPVGTEIYRNHDAEFNRMLENENSAVRKIGVKMRFSETETGFALRVVDEDGHEHTASFDAPKDLAKNADGLIDNIKKNLGKTGNTPFMADEIEVDFSQNWFLPNSKVNEIRRVTLEELAEIRIRDYQREEQQILKTDHPYPVQTLDFTYNVSNKLARQFYHRHGVEEIEKAFELQWDPGKSRVMVTKYCVKYELGKCPRYQRATMGTKVAEPLTLKHGEVEYKLKFNCKPCEMEIWEKDAELVLEEDGMD